MRAYGILCLILAVFLVITPLLSMSGDINFVDDLKNSIHEYKDNKETEKSTAENNAKNNTTSNNTKSKKDTFKVLITKSQKVIEVSEQDYIIGAVACEMPATYHVEALKSQASACYTYAVKMRNQQKTSPNSALLGADISDDDTTNQGYLSKEALKEKWGDKFDNYYNKIEKAVNEVLGYVITYNGELITAAFHAISSGTTENAEIVWGNAVPYLVSVTSTGDKLSPNYLSTTVLTTAQFKEMAAKLEGAVLGDDPSTWVGVSNKSTAGTVTSILMGSKEFKGSDVRSAFSLRSSNFTIEYKNDSFIINVIGYGHGVGLSQYGADYMARQGSTYKEILSHYYTGVKIEKL